MRFYVHFEGEPDFTYIAKWEDPKATFTTLKNQFAAAYNKKHGEKRTLNPKCISISNKKVTYQEDDIVSEKLSEKCDVFVIEEGVKSVAELSELARKLKDEGNVLMEEKQYEKAIQKYSLALEYDPTNTILYSNRSQAYLSMKKYKEAIEDANRVILLDKNNYKAHFRKGNALFKLRLFAEAEATFQTAISIPNLDSKSKATLHSMLQQCKEELTKAKQGSNSNSSSGASDASLSTLPPNPSPSSSSDLTNKEVQVFLMKAHHIAKTALENKNFRHALTVYEQCLGVYSLDRNSLLGIGFIWFNANHYDKAVHYLSLGVTSYPLDYEFSLYLGDTYMGKKDHAEAAKCYGAALEKVGDKNLQDNIRVKIGDALYEGGAQGSAVKIWQEILGRDSEHYAALYSYSLALKAHSGVGDAIPVLLKLLVKNPGDSRVKQKLAESIKENGGFEALKKELSTIPQSPSALAYLAMIIKENGALKESAQLYREAIELAPSSASYVLNLVHILELMYQYNDAFIVIKKYCHDYPNIGLGPLTCAHIYNAIRGYASILVEEEIVPPELPTETRQPIPLTDSYSPDELDLLALFCTLVKVLYVVGNLVLIPKLSALINPVREKRPMHTTTIRNEHAYFCCIDQLMPYHIETTIDNSLPILYLSGDSHALVSAWQKIKFRNTTHLIRPLLVTGLKCWHLRPDSTFYPKVNFWNVIPNAPWGSHVVFQFGEIDCREGLVVSVQKCIYEDIAEGARVAIDIYINVLLEVKQKYGYHIYIHPPAPVIDVTRDIVKIFTKILKQRILETEGLHWLDFADDLLLPDKTALVPEFDLDGTHMNPKYLYLLENALSKVTEQLTVEENEVD